MEEARPCWCPMQKWRYVYVDGLECWLKLFLALLYLQWMNSRRNCRFWNNRLSTTIFSAAVPFKESQMIGFKLMIRFELQVFNIRSLWYFWNIIVVDVSSSTITKVDRINTWLTCTEGCPSANGSNNIRRTPGEDLKFWVYLRRDGTLNPPFTVQTVLNGGFEIHYEVEGPCA